MIVYILQGLFLLSCITLIVAVLLQPGKTDAGALFTSSISSTAFGARGTQTILSKITIGAAICFMLSALLLAMPAIRGNVSVLNSAGTSAESVTIPDANANANVSGNAETNTNSAANESNTSANITNNATNTTANSNAAENK